MNTAQAHNAPPRCGTRCIPVWRLHLEADAPGESKQPTSVLCFAPRSPTVETCWGWQITHCALVRTGTAAPPWAGPVARAPPGDGPRPAFCSQPRAHCKATIPTTLTTTPVNLMVVKGPNNAMALFVLSASIPSLLQVTALLLRLSSWP